MKNLFLKTLFSLGILLIIISCSNQSSVEDQELFRSSKKSEFKFESLTNSPIGELVDGKIKIEVSKAQILNAFENFISQNHLENEKPLDVKVITLDNKKYLRIYSEKNEVSTLELIAENNVLRTGSTVCTSTACASGGGCVPDGQYCTECRTGVNGSLKGDCTRTTTGGSNPGISAR